MSNFLSRERSCSFTARVKKATFQIRDIFTSSQPLRLLFMNMYRSLRTRDQPKLHLRYQVTGTPRLVVFELSIPGRWVPSICECKPHTCRYHRLRRSIRMRSCMRHSTSLQLWSSRVQSRKTYMAIFAEGAQYGAAGWGWVVQVRHHELKYIHT